MEGFSELQSATTTVDDLPEVSDGPSKRRTLTKQQREHVTWFLSKAIGDFDETKGLINTHTAHVAEFCDEFDLCDDFTTVATGKEGAKGRNCCLTPYGKGWACTRYGGASESGTGWKPNKNGNYQFIIGKKGMADPAGNIVSDALETDTFYNWQGTAYVEVRRGDRKDTLLVKSEMYQRLLRVRFRNKYQAVPKAEWIHNANEMLVAIAIEEGEEIPVYVRQAYVGGKLYIDLADRERRVIEIDGEGYRPSQSCPVRFLRTDKMSALPSPEDGGTLEDLRQFINCEPEDWSLWIGSLLGMYLPFGTIPLTSLIGGDGRAKTSQGLIFLALVDPSIIKGCSPPENNEDLMLAVQQRWLYFIDNLSGIPTWLSDALCRLASGGATERRTKYKDRDTSVFIAKRPCLVTSITDVVAPFPDLDSRTIKFDLPSVRDKRKGEAELWRDFEAKRPKILGAIYSALSAAIKNLPETKVKDLPRLADWALWVAAAEPATGLASGSILATYADARGASLKELLDAPTAKKVIEFTKSEKKWQGTGAKLAEKIKPEATSKQAIQDFVGDLRTLQSALETQGVLLSFRRSHGKKLITLTYVAP